MRLIPALAICLALAACNKAAEDAADHEMAGADRSAAQESAQPEMRPVTFEAMSKTAEAFTGAISLTALARADAGALPAMRMQGANGLAYETELVPGGADQAIAINWSDVFGAPIDLASRDGAAPTVDIHLVTSQTVPKVLVNGGLCGATPVFALAMAAPLGEPGISHIGIAAFRGEQWPPAGEAALCGVFNYALP